MLAAGYILWTLQRILFGPSSDRHEGLTDASWLEKVPVVALIIAIVVVGVYPAVITDVLDTALPDMIRFRMP